MAELSCGHRGRRVAAGLPGVSRHHRLAPHDGGFVLLDALAGMLIMATVLVTLAGSIALAGRYARTSYDRAHDHVQRLSQSASEVPASFTAAAADD